MEESHCSGCGAIVVWALTEKKLRRMPLNPTPSPNGNIFVYANPVGALIAHVLASDEERKGQTLYTSHFATCPNAKDFRRK